MAMIKIEGKAGHKIDALPQCRKIVRMHLHSARLGERSGGKNAACGKKTATSMASLFQGGIGRKKERKGQKKGKEKGQRNAGLPLAVARYSLCAQQRFQVTGGSSGSSFSALVVVRTWGLFMVRLQDLLVLLMIFSSR
jgi:hypothetical protein